MRHLVLQADADPSGLRPFAGPQLVLQAFTHQLQLLHHCAGAQALGKLLLGADARDFPGEKSWEK